MASDAALADAPVGRRAFDAFAPGQGKPPQPYRSNRRRRHLLCGARQMAPEADRRLRWHLLSRVFGQRDGTHESISGVRTVRLVACSTGDSHDFALILFNRGVGLPYADAGQESGRRMTSATIGITPCTGGSVGRGHLRLPPLLQMDIARGSVMARRAHVGAQGKPSRTCLGDCPGAVARRARDSAGTSECPRQSVPIRRQIRQPGRTRQVQETSVCGPFRRPRDNRACRTRHLCLSGNSRERGSSGRTARLRLRGHGTYFCRTPAGFARVCRPAP